MEIRQSPKAELGGIGIVGAKEMVSKERQLDKAQVQKLLVEMLQQFADYCEKHGLRYYLVGGTLLGAVRHKGFIPWDDDLDFGLIRKEYELLRCYFLENQDSSGMVRLSYNNRTEVLNFDITHKVFYLSKKQLSGPSLAVEFFSFDYYREDYKFNDFKKDAQMIKIGLCSFLNEEEKINYVMEQIKKNKYIVKKAKMLWCTNAAYVDTCLMKRQKGNPLLN